MIEESEPKRYTVEDMDSELGSLEDLVLEDVALTEEEVSVMAEKWPEPKMAKANGLPKGWRNHKVEESPPHCMGCGDSLRAETLSLQAVFNGETSSLSASMKSKGILVCFSHKDAPNKLVCLDCVPMGSNPLTYKSAGQVRLPKVGEDLA